MLLTLTSFSQTVTNDSVVVIPLQTALQIAEDLVKYDECVEVLHTTNELLNLANKKIAKQDTIITESLTTYMLCRTQVGTQDQQLTIFKDGLATLNEENERLKGGIKWLGGATIVSTLTAVLVLFIK
mgnify:CR=1 FL=1|tara:strand:+ start:455 stop:835 length:381 start_codon:yes stop_codon:yes gene_type:complete